MGKNTGEVGEFFQFGKVGAMKGWSYCYLGKRHSGTLVIIYPLLCNVSLNIKVKQ